MMASRMIRAAGEDMLIELSEMALKRVMATTGSQMRAFVGRRTTARAARHRLMRSLPSEMTGFGFSFVVADESSRLHGQ